VSEHAYSAVAEYVSFDWIRKEIPVGWMAIGRITSKGSVALTWSRPALQNK